MYCRFGRISIFLIETSEYVGMQEVSQLAKKSLLISNDNSRISGEAAPVVLNQDVIMP